MVNNFVFAVIFLSSLDTSRAWTATLPSRTVSSCSSNTALNAAPSSALRYRVNDDHQGMMTLLPNNALFSTANSGVGAAVSVENVFGSELDMEVQLEAALNHARDMDRVHGLCSPASTRAWQVVDGLYLASSASQQVEESVKQVFGGEKSVWSLHERS